MRAIRRMLVVLAILCLVVSTASAGPHEGGGSGGGNKGSGSGEQVPRSIDPYLWRMSKENPGAKIPVIVQLGKRGQDMAKLARDHGGSLKDSFKFINGFRMELPAAAVARLASNPAVRYISVDTAVSPQTIDTSSLQTIYNQVAGSVFAWNTTGLTGKGVSVAVLDTGVNQHEDLKDHLTVIRTNSKALSGNDANGHGTHVAGVIAGRSLTGRYYGVAPDAQIIGIKIADDQGMSTEGDLLRGMQWVYDNRAQYNIKVVNISISGSVPTSYLDSALDAGVEQLWRAGIFVVVAAGNRGNVPDAVQYPPGNDAFAMTVGALDDNITQDPADDSLAFFSSLGMTQDGLVKPELVAPGRKIVSTLASKGATLAQRFPERITDDKYIRLSGTSMAAPVVAGAAALILQKYPNLTPDQLKWLFINSAHAYAGQPAGTGPALDIPAALKLAASGSIGSANQGLAWNKGMDQTTSTINWASAYWESAYWESAYSESADEMFTDFD